MSALSRGKMYIYAPHNAKRGVLVKTQAEVDRRDLERDSWMVSLKAMTAASMAVMKDGGGPAAIRAAVTVIERAGYTVEMLP